MVAIDPTKPHQEGTRNRGDEAVTSTIDLAQTLHPNWHPWQPDPSLPNAVSVHAKLVEGNHWNVQKCTVDPREARAISEVQGLPSDMGFWIIPPRRAPADADVRLFSCGERCHEAGTSLIIPEFSMGYPAAAGSIILIRKGVGYGLGVTNADIFDRHVSEGRDCCCRNVVMLKSTQQVAVKSHAGRDPSETHTSNPIYGVATAVEDDLEYIRAKTLVGPAAILSLPRSKRPIGASALKNEIISSSISMSRPMPSITMTKIAPKSTAKVSTSTPERFTAMLGGREDAKRRADGK